MAKPETSKSAARGRPALSEEEMADMRRHITVCAHRLFQEDGYDGVSMRRLASEAGCTVMTLYRYFDRKIDILRQLWGEVFAELFDELDIIAEKEPDPEKRLNEIALGYVNYWLNKREHYFLVFMSSGVSQPDVSVFVSDESVIERFFLFFDCLSKALGDDAAPEDINLKAQLLICMLNGISHNLITISGYSWAAPNELVGIAVSGALKA